MQNMDFYEGNNFRDFSASFPAQDPEFFSKISDSRSENQNQLNRKASRIIFVIAALCIVSFTTGLAIGIKFAGGNDRQIVDDTTYQAMSNLKSKVSGLMSGDHAAADAKDQFPAEEYPFVIKIGATHSKEMSKDIATYLSSAGNRVILTRTGKYYKIYTGPYKSLDDAKNSLKQIAQSDKYSISTGNKIIKRK